MKATLTVDNFDKNKQVQVDGKYHRAGFLTWNQMVKFCKFPMKDNNTRKQKEWNVRELSDKHVSHQERKHLKWKIKDHVTADVSGFGSWNEMEVNNLVFYPQYSTMY